MVATSMAEGSVRLVTSRVVPSRFTGLLATKS